MKLSKKRNLFNEIVKNLLLIFKEKFDTINIDGTSVFYKLREYYEPFYKKSIHDIFLEKYENDILKKSWCFSLQSSSYTKMLKEYTSFKESFNNDKLHSNIKEVVLEIL